MRLSNYTAKECFKLTTCYLGRSTTFGRMWKYVDGMPYKGITSEDPKGGLTLNLQPPRAKGTLVVSDAAFQLCVITRPIELGNITPESNPDGTPTLIEVGLKTPWYCLYNLHIDRSQLLRLLLFCICIVGLLWIVVIDCDRSSDMGIEYALV